MQYCIRFFQRFSTNYLEMLPVAPWAACCCNVQSLLIQLLPKAPSRFTQLLEGYSILADQTSSSSLRAVWADFQPHSYGEQWSAADFFWAAVTAGLFNSTHWAHSRVHSISPPPLSPSQIRANLCTQGGETPCLAAGPYSSCSCWEMFLKQRINLKNIHVACVEIYMYTFLKSGSSVYVCFFFLFSLYKTEFSCTVVILSVWL